MAYSPDGNILASGGEDEKVLLWDVETGIPITALKGHFDGITSVAYSPDGSTLASASRDETIRLWDAGSGQQKAILRGHHNNVWSVAFAPDGTTLASSGGTILGIEKGGWFEEDEVIYGWETALWDAESGRLVATLEKQKHRVWSVAFSPHGHILASGRGDGAVRLWDADSGGPLASLRKDRGLIRSLAFSPDGYTLASGSWNGTIRLWSAITGRLKATSQVDAGAIYSVSFSLDSQVLASASYDGLVRLWDVDTGQLQTILKGHSQWAQSVAFSPDGATLASASWDGTILLWDMSPYVTPFLAPGPGEEMSPTASVLDAPAPNPFNITTLIPYRLAAAGPVRLEIHNILGQAVYTLVDQYQGAGRYQVYWNGRDQRGAAVGSGVYFVRLQYPGGVKTRRLIHVK